MNKIQEKARREFRTDIFFEQQVDKMSDMSFYNARISTYSRGVLKLA